MTFTSRGQRCFYHQSVLHKTFPFSFNSTASYLEINQHRYKIKLRVFFFRKSLHIRFFCENDIALQLSYSMLERMSSIMIERAFFCAHSRIGFVSNLIHFQKYAYNLHKPKIAAKIGCLQVNKKNSLKKSVAVEIQMIETSLAWFFFHCIVFEIISNMFVRFELAAAWAMMATTALIY